MDVLLQSLRGVLYFVETHDYVALFLVMMVEEAGVPMPVPGDVVVAYAGVWVAEGKVVWPLILLDAVGGTVLGSWPFYWLARAKGRPLLVRYARYLHLTPERIERVERWMQRHGMMAVFIGRLIPGFRVAMTPIAGVFGVSFPKFQVSIALSALVAWGAWLWVGSIFGHRLLRLLEFTPVQYLVMLTAIVIIAGILYRRGDRAVAGRFTNVHLRLSDSNGRGVEIAGHGQARHNPS